MKEYFSAFSRYAGCSGFSNAIENSSERTRIAPSIDIVSWMKKVHYTKRSYFNFFWQIDWQNHRWFTYQHFLHPIFEPLKEQKEKIMKKHQQIRKLWSNIASVNRLIIQNLIFEFIKHTFVVDCKIKNPENNLSAYIIIH